MLESQCKPGVAVIGKHPSVVGKIGIIYSVNTHYSKNSGNLVLYEVMEPATGVTFLPSPWTLADWEVPTPFYTRYAITGFKLSKQECPCGIHPSRCDYHKES